MIVFHRYHRQVVILIFMKVIIIVMIMMMMMIIIIVIIINLIRSGRGLINMSEFESSRRLEEAIQLEPGLEYSVRVITR